MCVCVYLEIINKIHIYPRDHINSVCVCMWCGWVGGLAVFIVHEIIVVESFKIEKNNFSLLTNNNNVSVYVYVCVYIKEEDSTTKPHLINVQMHGNYDGINY